MPLRLLGTDRVQRTLSTAGTLSRQSVQFAAPLGPDRLVADVLAWRLGAAGRPPSPCPRPSSPAPAPSPLKHPGRTGRDNEAVSGAPGTPDAPQAGGRAAASRSAYPRASSSSA